MDKHLHRAKSCSDNCHSGAVDGNRAALLFSWLSDRYGRRRDLSNFENGTVEATRVEHLKRDLAALETFSEAAVGIQTDLSAATAAAFSEDPALWNTVFASVPSLARAISTSAIDFPKALSPEWEVVRRAYRAAVDADTALAHASFRKVDRRLAEGQSDVELAEQLDAAKRALSVCAKDVMAHRQPLLNKISEVAQKLRAARQSGNR